MRIGRRRNHTRIPRTNNIRKQRPLPHIIPMRTHHRSQHTHLQPLSIPRRDGNSDRVVIFPVLVLNHKSWLREAGEEIGGREDLDAVFFGEGIDGVGVVACGVGAGD